MRPLATRPTAAPPGPCLARCPELQAACDQVRAFATMLTGLTGQDLPQWIATARETGLPGIAGFAKGLEPAPPQARPAHRAGQAGR